MITLLDMVQLVSSLAVLLIRVVFVIEQLGELSLEGTVSLFNVGEGALLALALLFKQSNGLEHFLLHHSIRLHELSLHRCKYAFLAGLASDNLLLQSLDHLVFFAHHQLIL